MIFYELSAGGGMARLAFGEGWMCAFANDIDPKKGAAYIRNFGPGEMKVCDIAALTTADLPGQADLCWMSPPCVGFSEAGDKEGFDEKQSGSFWPAWKLIEGLVAEGRAPRVVAFENVPGLLTSHNGEDIAAIRRAFEACGYMHATIAIDAKSFVPQSRPRIFIIAAHGPAGAKVAALAAKAAGNLPRRNVDLIDLLDLDAPPDRWEFSPAKIAHHLAMLGPASRERVDQARLTGRPIAGPFARRMRDVPGSAKRIQQVEVRLDGLTNALRVADGGGSSKTVPHDHSRPRDAHASDSTARGGAADGHPRGLRAAQRSNRGAVARWRRSLCCGRAISRRADHRAVVRERRKRR
jgi:DNA (cytosine-5)-methyltransferase 1